MPEPISQSIPKIAIRCTINGKPIQADVEPRTLLVEFIREDLDLTGTHIGCDTSFCGACTVLVNGHATKSCTLFAFQADGAEVLTVEGLMRDGQLHPVQQAFADNHGLQCGYCTPGMMMSSLELIEHTPHPTEKDIRKGLAGNCCRCTGYQNIFKSVSAAAQAMSAKGAR